MASGFFMENLNGLNCKLLDIFLQLSSRISCTACIFKNLCGTIDNVDGLHSDVGRTFGTFICGSSNTADRFNDTGDRGKQLF